MVPGFGLCAETINFGLMPVFCSADAKDFVDETAGGTGPTRGIAK